MTTTPTVSYEASGPVSIGAGSFATVYAVRGGIVAYKQVALSGDLAAAELEGEYRMLTSVYTACSTDSFFTIPRAFAFRDVILGFSAPERGSLPLNQRQERPFVDEGMLSIFPRATYAMDRVHAIQHDIGLDISQEYFPSGLSDKGVALCRLYFGRNYQNAPIPRFINTTNFPLDEYRYTRLRERYPDYLEPVSKVAAGIGEMLSKLHYRAHCDARDIEFVLGGTGAAGITYYVIDYNQLIYPAGPQVKPWNKSSDVSPLVSAFFDNDPYYPRPVEGDPLYTVFRDAYLEAAPTEEKATAMLFLKAIEQEQLERQSRRATS